MNEMEEYITSLKRKNTQIYYRLCLNRYFKTIATTPNNYFVNKKKKIPTYEKHIQKFVDDIKGLAPVTQKNYISVIKNFFLDNDIEFKYSYWKREVRNKIEDGGALTLDRAPTTEELKKILSYGDLKARALFMFLATSGMRIGETLQIQLNDIDLKHDPGKINIRSTYVKGKKKPRWTFISDECKDLLLAWLESREHINPDGSKVIESERDRYLRIAVDRIKGCKPKSLNDNRVFPICDSMARQMWAKLIHKAGCDQRSNETDRFELHIHSLRKFFMSEMKLELPDVIVEAYAGHSKYLDEAYKRYTLQQLAEFYKKGMHRLLIFESQDLSDVSDKLSAVEKKNKELEELMHMQSMQLDIQKLQMESMENKLKELGK